MESVASSSTAVVPKEKNYPALPAGTAALIREKKRGMSAIDWKIYINTKLTQIERLQAIAYTFKTRTKKKYFKRRYKRRYFRRRKYGGYRRKRYGGRKVSPAFLKAFNQLMRSKQLKTLKM